jgi:DNA-binding NarL/FixJ family response regulator
MEFLSLLILHHNRLFRESLTAVLGDSISRVISMGDVRELDTSGIESRADIVLLDLCLANRDGFKAHLRSLYPDAKLIVLGIQEEEADILACFEKIGAAAYLLEDASLEELVTCLKAVMQGEVHCSPRATAFLVSRLNKCGMEAAYSWADGKLNTLTPREREIVRLIETGLSNKDIAKRLFIEVQTVKNHVHNILGKLKVQGRRQAALYSRGRLVPHKPTDPASLQTGS